MKNFVNVPFEEGDIQIVGVCRHCKAKVTEIIRRVEKIGISTILLTVTNAPIRYHTCTHTKKITNTTGVETYGIIDVTHVIRHVSIPTEKGRKK